MRLAGDWKFEAPLIELVHVPLSVLRLFTAFDDPECRGAEARRCCCCGRRRFVEDGMRMRLTTDWRLVASQIEVVHVPTVVLHLFAGFDDRGCCTTEVICCCRRWCLPLAASHNALCSESDSKLDKNHLIDFLCFNVVKLHIIYKK